MKKSEQLAVNARVLHFLEINPDLKKPCVPTSEWKQLRSCSADFIRIGHYFILRSYATVIAVYDTQNDTLYDFLRYVYGYTTTSAQHITKFYNEFCNRTTIRLTYKEV